MGLLPRVFGRPNAGGLGGGRKVGVADRLDRFVVTVARDAVEPARVSYIVDKNYEVVFTGPAPRK